MKIDVDQAMAVMEHQQKALPWDLTLTIGGKDFKVKPLTIADMVEMSRVQEERDIVKVRELMQRVLGLAEPADFKDEQIGPAFLAISLGFAEHVKKKSQILERAMLASLAANHSTPGA